jgi:hypothetical protein
MTDLSEVRAEKPASNVAATSKRRPSTTPTAAPVPFTNVEFVRRYIFALDDLAQRSHESCLHTVTAECAFGTLVARTTCEFRNWVDEWTELLPEDHAAFAHVDEASEKLRQACKPIPRYDHRSIDQDDQADPASRGAAGKVMHGLIVEAAQAIERAQLACGQAPTFGYLRGLDRKWPGSLSPSVLPDNSIPQTEADGRARCVRLLTELRYMNANTSKPKASEKRVDAAVCAAMTWPAPARRGFTAMISGWMVDMTLGFVRDVHGEAEEFGAAADEPYFAELARLESEENDAAIARDEAKAAARAARRPQHAPAAAPA